MQRLLKLRRTGKHAGKQPASAIHLVAVAVS